MKNLKNFVTLLKKAAVKKGLMQVFAAFTVFVFSGNVFADGCNVRIVYAGKGSGEVVFDAALHATRGLTCADCHEERGLMPPIFKMEKGANTVTMRKIEMGRSCGHCHPVSEADLSTCGICHRK